MLRVSADSRGMCRGRRSEETDEKRSIEANGRNRARTPMRIPFEPEMTSRGSGGVLIERRSAMVDRGARGGYVSVEHGKDTHTYLS